MSSSNRVQDGTLVERPERERERERERKRVRESERERERESTGRHLMHYFLIYFINYNELEMADRAFGW